MTLEARVEELYESIADKAVAARQVVALVRASLQAEALAKYEEKIEALAAHRREIAAERQRRHRAELSRAVTDVTRDVRDRPLHSVTAVPPGPPSGSSLSSLKAPDPERAIPVLGARATGKAKPIAPPEYPESFENFWRASGIGSKAEALKAWTQVGKPDPVALTEAWKRWQSIAWVDGFGVPHVSTWLRKFDWREQPKAKPRPRLGGPALEKGVPMPPETPPDPKPPPELRGWKRQASSSTEPEPAGALLDEMPGWMEGQKR